MEDRLIKVVRCSRWKFFRYYAFSWLLIPLILAYIFRRSVKFRIYSDRIVLEEGILSKDLKVIFISDIRTIDVRQTFLQRMLRMGDLLIATSGTSGYENEVQGLPNPARIKDIISAQRSGEISEPEEAYESVDEDEDDEFIDDYDDEYE